MTSPKVTVILVTDNDQEFVTAALESVLRQTYRTIEVVVCDQGSTDGTYSILTNFKDDRLKVSQGTGGGYFAGVNQAVQLATGEFILEFSPRGIMKPAMIRSLVTLIEKNNTSICGVSQFVKVDNNGLIVDRPKLPNPGDEMALELLLSNEPASAPLLLRRNFIGRSLYKTGGSQSKLDLLWSANKSGRLVLSQEYLAAARPAKPGAGLWGKRYTVLSILWRFPQVARNLPEDKRDAYGEKVIGLYKTAFRRKDYVFGLIILFCALRSPGYRHEFLRMVRLGK